MIEELIRSAADAYYASITKEQFAADLRDAGFTVYEVERVGQTEFKGSYVSPDSSFSIDDGHAEYIVPLKHSEKVELPAWTYRIADSFIGSGEFILNKDAA